MNEPLGIYVKYSSPFEAQNPLSDADNLVLQRYELQAAARSLLMDFGIRKCHRVAVPVRRSKDNMVDIFVSTRRRSAFYGNLVTCKSVWVCPICASKITERRREELTAALDASPYHQYLVTYTLRHKASDSLNSVLGAITKAFDYLKAGKGWQAIKSRWCWVGDVKSLEVTHGQSGWHVHIHQLAFLACDLPHKAQCQFADDLKSRWAYALSQTGFDASWERGVDVRSSDAAISEYVTKDMGNWTLEQEMTKATVKKGRNGGRTPRQLLDDYRGGDVMAGQLFQEYAVEFKGKRQLIWSNGLRDLLGLEDMKTDAQLIDEREDSAVLLGSLSAQQWLTIKALNLRGWTLIVARNAYWDENLPAWAAYLREIDLLGA